MYSLIITVLSPDGNIAIHQIDNIKDNFAVKEIENIYRSQVSALGCRVGFLTILRPKQ